MRLAFKRFLHRFITSHKMVMKYEKIMFGVYDISGKCSCGDKYYYTIRPKTVKECYQLEVLYGDRK